MGHVLEVKNVTKKFTVGRSTVLALNNVSCTLDKGDFVCLNGPSGSGKTTLLNIIGCIERVTSGDVFINNTNVHNLNDKQLTNVRANSIGFIFQSFNLLPVLNIFENVEIPVVLKNKNMSKKDRKDIIMPLLEKLGLSSHIKHKPNELSGGQRQRVAIARALVNNPEIVLADEPTANLDFKTGLEIVELMKKINKDSKTTFLISSHDPRIIELADKKIHIQDGVIMS